MVFDLTSTQQASQDFIHPELTNCSIPVELKFSVALPNNIEIFIIGEKDNTIFVDKLKMDEDDINDLIQRCALLKHKFLGVFAANNFPQNLKPNSFLIVNAATAEAFGTHWLLLCQKKEEDQLFFADPLGQSISSYIDV